MKKENYKYIIKVFVILILTIVACVFIINYICLFDYLFISP